MHQLKYQTSKILPLMLLVGASMPAFTQKAITKPSSPQTTENLNNVTALASQIVSHKEAAPIADTQKKNDGSDTPKEIIDFDKFVIDNAFVLRLGATLLDYRVPRSDFQTDIANTKDADCVFDASTKLVKDIFYTVNTGLKNFTDGNTGQLNADKKQYEDCHWNETFSTNAEKRDLGKPDPNFDTSAYDAVDEPLSLKGSKLPGDDDLLGVLQRGEREKLVKFALDSYVADANAPAEIEPVIRKETLPNAKAYADTIFSIYSNYNHLGLNGLDHDRKGPNGIVETLNTIKAQKLDLLQISDLGETAAAHILKTRSSFLHKSNNVPMP